MQDRSADLSLHLKRLTSDSKSQFHDLLEKLPMGAYTCDADGLITYFNEPAEKLWGRAPKLNDPADRFCGSFKLFSADGSPIAHDRCWMALALSKGQDFCGEEIIIERPDGERVVVLAHANPIRDAAGKIIGAVNVLVDISDRKHAEVAQKLLAAIVDSSEDAIVSKSLEGRILSWNAGAERLFGYAASEAIGQSIMLIIPPENHGEEREILARLRHGERIEHYETVRQAKDGRRLAISLTISPLFDGQGRLVGASKIARDITSQKQAQQENARLYAQLRRADQKKDEFLATLAHELRNPLAPISNSLHLLRLSDDIDPAVKRVHEIMEQQVKQMSRLVDDLLDVSRIASGKIELRKEPVELAAIVSSAVETSRPIIEAAGHQLAISLPPEPVTLEADPIRMGQVISNLLNNAAKYTPKGGQIWLSARREGIEVAISVRDSGLGIPADMLQHVFEMFAQMNDTINRAQGGLGIGLTLAKSLVQMHGGRIEARSDGPGRGSEFVVRLPAVRHSPSMRVRASAPESRKLPLPKRRILVVDDTPAAGFILGKLLEAMGQRVWTTHDGRAALELARREVPDMVISDIGMPNMDGYELARRLREEPSLEGVVLVALTGYGQDDDRQRVEEAGFDHHLIKPASFDAIQNLLASLPSTSRT